MAIEFAKKVRVDDTLEMGYYIDDCTDPWTIPDTIVMLPGCRKPRQVFYAWIPTLAREFRVIRPHLRGHWDSTRETPESASPARGAGNPCGRSSGLAHRASTRCARHEIARRRIDVASFILPSVVIIDGYFVL